MTDPFLHYRDAAGVLKIGGLPEGPDALIFGRAALVAKRDMVFVARDDARASSFLAALRFLHPKLDPIHIPAWDCLPYDRLSPSRTLSAQRASGLSRLLQRKESGEFSILVTTIKSVAQVLPPVDVLGESSFSAKPGAVVSREALQTYLGHNGYNRVSVVVEAGDYAIRGGIVDIFPPSASEPLRLDFFGDELETIRSFDPDTQRTTRQLKDVNLGPVSELFLTEDTISKFRRNYIAAFGGGVSSDPIYAAVSEGSRPQGIEHFLPLFYDSVAQILDYLGEDPLIAFDSLADESFAEHESQIADYYEARQQAQEASKDSVLRVLEPNRLYLTRSQWVGLTRTGCRRWHSAFTHPDGDGAVNFDGRIARNFSPERRSEGTQVFDAVAAHINALKAGNQKVVLTAWTDGSAERLGGVLADHNVLAAPLRSGQTLADIKDGSVRLAVWPLEAGFDFQEYRVISEQDILGDRLVSRKHRRRAKNFISDATALQPGDLVVHLDHGIARYIGLKTITVQNISHDCVELEYAGQDRLFLPVENIELLSRYGAAPETVFLDRLGGAAWQARKSKAKTRLKDLAEGLIKIAAQRALKTADIVEVPQGVFDEFCARFPYTETDDQLDAIEDVTGDMASGHPMDRLICGDVGFGKTEVALRAAFIAAMSGRQVAIIAPTTVLARQHYKTFVERFRGWPVKVRHLSRLVGTKDAAEAKEKIENGTCDIVVGTHALLAKNIKFNDLGLLVIDEEQRFGVKHKERLKSLKADVHVLTMTATPIPRTLQMALAGIRELSLISTPPVDRLAVRTYVSPFDSVMIREALLREKYRGGQSFFVVPRIKDLAGIEEYLREQVPEVKYVIAHGQMAGGKLEDVMTAFYEGKYDILLSTSIIESGLDIPTANTMIIHRADRFGLAQLYQMRGRVGRSKIRAYCYLSLPPGQKPTPGAEQRLKLLHSLDTLGAGFTLASHDLDMRGGGNLLGEEQTGHIKDLGVELYQTMLEEAVASLQDDPQDRGSEWSPVVNVGVSMLIPETYVEDLNIRLSLYRRLADIESTEAGEGFAAELIDRFGPLPEEVQNLLGVMSIKRMCRDIGISKLDAGPRGGVVTIREGTIDDPSKILEFLSQNVNWRLRPDQSLLISGSWEQDDPRLRGVRREILKLLNFLKPNSGNI